VLVTGPLSIVTIPLLQGRSDGFLSAFCESSKEIRRKGSACRPILTKEGPEPSLMEIYEMTINDGTSQKPQIDADCRLLPC
jgi:hypothetical protein